ncbi:hypothetical protein X781_5270 [Mannheimia sp. USDA-ARS-USMARC-1261]|nr:hypothetical protein X781_5270 [Mannheimia sp. USDA-ARS-USMARC-1261]
MNTPLVATQAVFLFVQFAKNIFAHFAKAVLRFVWFFHNEQSDTLISS